MELTYKQLLFHVLTHAQELSKSIKTEITLEEQLFELMKSQTSKRNKKRETGFCAV